MNVVLTSGVKNDRNDSWSEMSPVLRENCPSPILMATWLSSFRLASMIQEAIGNDVELLDSCSSRIPSISLERYVFPVEEVIEPIRSCSRMLLQDLEILDNTGVFSTERRQFRFYVRYMRAP